MEDKERMEFAQWLRNKTNARSDDEFQKILEEMGEEKIGEYYSEYKNAKARSLKLGGAIEYVRCLQSRMFKKGGQMTKGCGCGAKMEKGGKVKEEVEAKKCGGKIVEKTPAKKPHEIIKEGPKMKSPGKDIKESGKKMTPKLGTPTAVPGANSKKMMANGGKMREEAPKEKGPKKGLVEPAYTNKKTGVKEKKYYKK